GGELEAPGGGHDEPLRGVRVLVEPLPVAGEDDLVELRKAVVGELEVAQLDSALLRFDALPGGERDREIGPVAVEGLVSGRVERGRLELALAPIGPDHELEGR